MCLAVPGKVISIADNDSAAKMATVSFGGIRREVCLTLVPEVRLDDYVLVHAGFAISVIDEAEAQEIFEYLRQMDESPPAVEGGS
ncbi:MAG TPA: HypC/HybG/HupF family hydrogenase formation chaperone [Candidatus Deferrimicrobium sp.]|nr:HypC/HybG/HupF family hydrogenase formation chaperone [Candidatus Deferrimicrobium sp.]